jgi:lipopolysaccharide/colanic/teichoic acid biosynthesis glycosyltransferase
MQHGTTIFTDEKGTSGGVHRGGPFKRIYPAVKRLTDLLIATAAMLILWPLLVLIAVIVRLDSPGPALFRQVRVGRSGKPFTLLKFRTMRWGTRDMPTDQMMKQAISPVTRSGRFLRRTSLDELPQLMNVLKGEMSLVGPRPALPSQDYVNQTRRECGVEALLPGITGWAQVCGRDDLADADKVRHDAFYGANQSFGLDMTILARTVAAVFSGRGTR